MLLEKLVCIGRNRKPHSSMRKKWGQSYRAYAHPSRDGLESVNLGRDDTKMDKNVKFMSQSERRIFVKVKDLKPANYEL